MTIAEAEARWRAALVRRLESMPERLAAVAQRAAAPVDPEWSAELVVRHLVATEELVWQSRLAQLVSSAGTDGSQLSPPTWAWLEPGPWAGPGDDTLAGVLEELGRRRQRTVEVVAGLDGRAWGWYGIHATYGRLDVARLLTIAVDHDAEHIGQIAALIPAEPTGLGHAGTRDGSR